MSREAAESALLDWTAADQAWFELARQTLPQLDPDDVRTHPAARRGDLFPLYQVKKEAEFIFRAAGGFEAIFPALKGHAA